LRSGLRSTQLGALVRGSDKGVIVEAQVEDEASVSRRVW